jgi:hypothetical protein
VGEAKPLWSRYPIITRLAAGLTRFKNNKNYRPGWVRPPVPLGRSGGAGQGGYGLVQQGGCFARLLGVAWWEALLRVAPARGGGSRRLLWSAKRF